VIKLITLFSLLATMPVGAMKRTPEWTEEDFKEARQLVKKQNELNKQLLKGKNNGKKNKPQRDTR